MICPHGYDPQLCLMCNGFVQPPSVTWRVRRRCPSCGADPRIPAYCLAPWHPSIKAIAVMGERLVQPYDTVHHVRIWHSNTFE